ncbi:hypothetical protein [Kitasatospora sp. NBC_00315]|uniref:hypothetical protein n=1 Tax=Kitasatospora sp. NBC_00315 TaxID=2975963 RepID=UPI00324444D3
MKSFVKTMAVTAGALVAVTGAAPAAQAASAADAPHAEKRFFGYSLNKLKDFIETSAPVINTVGEAMGGPVYSDAITAVNGVTPGLNTFGDAAAPFTSDFGRGGKGEPDES